jgi:hypothetical protein
MIDAREPDAESAIMDVREAARQIGRMLLVLRVRSDAELEAAFATMAERAVGGVVIEGTATFLARSSLVVALATRLGLPAVYSVRVGPSRAA